MDNIIQIKQLVKDYQGAIHTQEEKAFRQLWTCEDNNTLISISKKYEGIESIYKDFLINGIQKAYKKIDLITDDINIHFINEELAIVIFQYHTECIKRDTLEEYGIEGLETQVVQKVNNEWKLVHIHYSKV